jgi:hypothetical protein
MARDNSKILTLSNNFRRANYGLLLISKQCVTKETRKNNKLKGTKRVKISTTKQKKIRIMANVQETKGKIRKKQFTDSFTVTEHFKVVNVIGLKIIASRFPQMASPPYRTSRTSTKQIKSY